MKLIKNILLTITAIILFIVMFIVSFFWSIIDLIRLKKTLFWRGVYFGFGYMLYTIALTLDRSGAIIGSRLWNAIFLTKKSELKFGTTNEKGEPYSISYVLGANYVDETLNSFGLWFKEFLDLFERNHVLKTIENNKN